MSDVIEDLNLSNLHNSDEDSLNSSDEDMQEPNQQEATEAESTDDESEEDKGDNRVKGWVPSVHRAEGPKEVLTKQKVFKVRQQASQHQTDFKKLKVHHELYSGCVKGMMSQSKITAGYGAVIGATVGNRHNISIKGHAPSVETEKAFRELVGDELEADDLLAIVEEIQPKWKYGKDEDGEDLPKGVNKSGPMDPKKALTLGLKYELKSLDIPADVGTKLAKGSLKLYTQFVKEMNACAGGGAPADKSQVQAAFTLGYLHAMDAVEKNEEPLPINNDYNYKKRPRYAWDD